MLDSLPIDEPFNWVERVSIELTTLMLATLLDFPLEDRRKLTRWSDIITTRPGYGLVDSWEQREQELYTCLEHFKALFSEREKAAPKTDLISMLAHSDDMKGMTDTDFLGLLALLIVGGNDTTRSSMSGGAYAFSLNPEAFTRLKEDRALLAVRRQNLPDRLRPDLRDASAHQGL